MTEKEKKLHKQIEELSTEIIMLRKHIKETLKSQNRDCAKCKSIGCSFYDEKMEFNCCANENIYKKCMNNQQSK